MPMPRFILPALLLIGPTASAQATRPPTLPLPAGTSTEVQARQRLTEAQRLMKEDTFGPAAVAFEEAIALDPKLMMAHFGLGTARMALKEYAAAAAAFEAARDAFHKRAAEHAEFRERGMISRKARIDLLEDSMRGGSYSGSERRQALQAEIRELERLQEESKKVPQLPPGFSLALGSAYFRSGRLADAEREYRAAIEAQPKLGEPRSNLAVILLLTGRPADAKEQLKMAEKSGFKPPAGLVADIEAALAKAPPQAP